MYWLHQDTFWLLVLILICLFTYLITSKRIIYVKSLFYFKILFVHIKSKPAHCNLCIYTRELEGFFWFFFFLIVVKNIFGQLHPVVGLG
jgi:hypothetical protein